MNYTLAIEENKINVPEIYTKTGDVKTRYCDSIDRVLADIDHKVKTNVYHFKYWSGSRRHMTLVESEHNRMIEVLSHLGIKYETGNDAPKGGATGDYIKVKYDYRNKNVKAIRKIIEERRQ